MVRNNYKLRESLCEIWTIRKAVYEFENTFKFYVPEKAGPILVKFVVVVTNAGYGAKERYGVRVYPCVKRKFGFDFVHTSIPILSLINTRDHNDALEMIADGRWAEPYCRDFSGVDNQNESV